MSACTVLERVLALAASLFLSALGATGQAQTAVVWPLRAEGASPSPAAYEVALEATSERGVQLIAIGQAEQELGDELAECAGVGCAHAMAQRLGVDVVVLVGMRGSGTVIVHCVGAESADEYTAPPIEVRDDLASAVRRATTQAWLLWETGQAVRVQLTSEPSGAQVSEGGRSYGATPTAHRLSLGEHELRFSLDGYQSTTERITVTRTMSDPVHVALSPEGAPVAGAGGGTATAGIALLIAGAVVFATGASVMIGGAVEASGGRQNIDEGLFGAWAAVSGVGLVVGVVGLVLFFGDGGAEGRAELGPMALEFGRL